jgi:hypothetical protein
MIFWWLADFGLEASHAAAFGPRLYLLVMLVPDFPMHLGNWVEEPA